MKGVRSIAVWLACVACCCAQPAERMRTWTDVQGRSMQAEYVREVNGDVAFLKDGKLVFVPLDRLSEADQKVIAALQGRGKVPEATAPPARAAKQESPTAPSQPVVPVPQITPEPNPAQESTKSNVEATTTEERRDQEAATQPAPPKSTGETPVPPNGETPVPPNVQGDSQTAAPPAPESTKPVERRRRRPQFEQPEDIARFFVAVPVIAAVTSLIGAVILRAAVYFLSGAPLPYGDAYVTVYLLTIANALLRFAAVMISNHVSDDTANLLVWVLPVVVFVVDAGIISSRLETTFWEACLVTLVMMLTLLAIVAIIVLIGFGALVGMKAAAG